MSKRLILILALAFVIGIAYAAYAEVQNVKVSGDLTLSAIMRGDWTLTNDEWGGADTSYPNWKDDKQQYFLRQVRVRVDADLTDNVSTTVRLLNEGVWGDTQIEHTYSSVTENDDEVYLDLAYATLKEFLYSPLTLTVGRQEIMYGNGMIVGDPDTNVAATGHGGTAGAVMSSTGNWFYHAAPDLTLRKAFDAIRMTLNYDPLVVDGIYAKIDEEDASSDDDTTLFGVNVAYDLKDARKTMAELYYFCKYIGRKLTDTSNPAKSKADRVNTIGARIKTEPIERLTASVEGAYQFGVYDPANDPNAGSTLPVRDRSAWAAQAMASYALNMKYNPVITGVFAAFSGEHDNQDSSSRPQDNYNAWDPMFENQSFGSINNALFEQSNQYILGIGGKMTPKEDITVGLEYYAYWLQKEFADIESAILNGLTNGYTYRMSNNRFLGQEIDLKLLYDYTEDVQFCLLAGVFIPGKAFLNGETESLQYYKNNNTATELIGSMKVTF